MKKNPAKSFLIAALFSAAVLLTSCESENNQQKEITVSWWGGESRHEATVSAIKAFEKENPDIKPLLVIKCGFTCHQCIYLTIVK